MGIALIIPSAKLIPEELRGIGELPPVIYPVNDNKEDRIDVKFDNVSAEGLEVFARRLASIEV